MPPCCWPEWPRSWTPASDQRGLSGLVDDVGWWSNTDTVLEPFIATDKPWPGREPLFSVSGRRNRDRASLRGQSWSDSARTHTQKLGGVIQLVGWTRGFLGGDIWWHFLLVACMQVGRSFALPSGGQNSKSLDYIKFLQTLRKVSLAVRSNEFMQCYSARFPPTSKTKAQQSDGQLQCTVQCRGQLRFILKAKARAFSKQGWWWWWH